MNKTTFEQASVKRYRCKKHDKLVTFLTIYGIFICSIFIIASGFRVMQKAENPIQSVKAVEAKQTDASTPLPSPSDTGVINTAPEHSCEARIKAKEDIRSYINIIFRSREAAKMAFSISLAESADPKAKCGTPVYLEAALHHSGVEHSVGIFQINLYNAEAWVHAARVPGKTLSEKEKWLQDPYNNILYAYWIWSTSDWTPWSTYGNGAYLKFLGQ